MARQCLDRAILYPSTDRRLPSSDQLTLDFIVRATNNYHSHTLKVLSIVPSPWSRWAAELNLAPLFALCKTSLIELHLQSRDLIPTQPILTDLISLRVITVTVDMESGDIGIGQSVRLVSRVCQMLQTLPSPNALQALQAEECSTVLPDSELTRVLGELDDILSTPKLSSVERLIFWVSSRPQDEEVLFQLLPKLQHRRILHFATNASEMLFPFGQTWTNSVFNSQ
ncbi:hypothetical protein BKA70DRAFT_199368 [Coprinopsis sp. MPI-PUGE-AT-0042]|nr:hypothetical protein BKA70DRAFT_199368 [Coprinopsis sp. MPI-PUGE-AT-0042]